MLKLDIVSHNQNINKENYSLNEPQKTPKPHPSTTCVFVKLILQYNNYLIV
jgi:hypothetical protein